MLSNVRKGDYLAVVTKGLMVRWQVPSIAMYEVSRTTPKWIVCATAVGEKKFRKSDGKSVGAYYEVTAFVPTEEQKAQYSKELIAFNDWNALHCVIDEVMKTGNELVGRHKDVSKLVEYLREHLEEYKDC